LFLLAIACHQPRIALVSFLAAGVVLLTLGSKSEKTPASLSPDRQAIGDGLALLVAIAIAVVVACLGNPDPVGMKVYCPTGKETFDDETTEEAPPRRDRGEAA
jgi:hypothetical protein